jgi:O-antigen ligase
MPLSVRVPRFSRFGAAQIGWTVAAAVVLGYVLGASDVVLAPFAVIGAVSLLAFGLTAPAVFVSIFLLVRPMLDDFGNGGGSSSGLNPAGLLGVLLIVVAVAYALTQKKLNAPRATYALVILFLLALVFGGLAFLNYRGAIGLRPVSELVRLLALFAMYFLAVNLFKTVPSAKRLIVIVGLSAVLPAIDGIVQWIGGAPVKQNVDLGRISGPFVGPNPFGDFLALGALVLIALPKGWIPRWARLAGIAMMVGALIGTYSRVGYILFLGGVLVLGWRVQRGAAIAVVLGAIIVVLTVPTVHDRVLPKASPTSSQEQTYESFSWRIQNWKGLLQQWERAPMSGYGIETVPFVNPRVLTDGNGNTSRFGGGFDAHNLVVKSLVEGGPLLLLAWAAVLISLITISVRLARDDWPLKQIGFLMVVVWSLIVVISCSTGEPTGESALMFALLAITGALEGAHRTWRREQREAWEREQAEQDQHADVEPATNGRSLVPA